MAPNRKRLTTWELTYPRIVHAELMTHRVFSRNSASSRAIPIKKMLEQVQYDPFEPVWWGARESGMQARTELEGDRLANAKTTWNQARLAAIQAAKQMDDCGLHKQIANRVLEPWMWITVILTATEFENWFNLRNHPDAQPEIGRVAKQMEELYESNIPQMLDVGEWHLPLVQGADWHLIPDSLRWPNERRSFMKKVSVGRCARVSYLTHDGKRDLIEDVKLHDRLLVSKHMSPFEHVAQAKDIGDYSWSGNFSGWTQYRHSGEL